MGRDFDIIIVGAGMAGSSLACALSATGFRVALLEAGRLQDSRPDAGSGVAGYDRRVSALNRASRQLLTDLGVWPQMVSLRVSPYTRMEVWDGQGTGEISFDAAEVHQDCLGHIVENRVTVWALQQRLQQCQNVKIMAACTVQHLAPLEGADVERGEPAYSLLLEDGRRLCASLIVAADGALSTIRSLARFGTREWDYGHVATVATVRTAQAHGGVARQRFTPDGPLAFLPLAGQDGARSGSHFSSIVWSQRPEAASAQASLDEAGFCRALSAAFENRLGPVDAAGPRASFPLRQRHAKAYFRPGIALIGDAAHTIHPLAGQGINLGFSDVAVLAEELARGERLGRSPGSPAVLGRFQRRRKADNLGMMAVMDGFKRLFEQRNLALRWLRNSGMRGVDRNQLIKQRIMRQAMGLE